MLFTSHLTIFSITFFLYLFRPKIAIPLRKHIQVYVVKISACGSFYFWSYTPWKIGFVASPQTSQKHVFQVKMS
jgi:hypothetical protein